MIIVVLKVQQVMSELRDRRTAAKMTETAEKQPLLQGRSKSAPFQRTPRPPTSRRPTRSIHISISLLILAAFVIYAQKNGLKKPSRVYELGGKPLPEYYAICSKEGKKVYTVPESEGLGPVDCVVVSGKYVVDIGSIGHVRRKWGDKATIGAVDQAPMAVRKSGGLPILYLPAGHSLTPGLVDSHGHPLAYGHSRQLQLQGSSSVAEVITRVETYVKTFNGSIPSGMWIEGMGWDQNKWPVKEFPTAEDLESSSALSGLPISLSRIDVHAEWVSPAVLKLMGDLPDHVEGGQIVRDDAGKPTGVFLDNAMDLINAVRPPWTDVQRRMFLDIMMEDALSKGLVGIHDAMVPVTDLAFYKRMADDDALRIRFYSMVYCEDRESYCGDSIPMVDNAQDGRLNVKAVKLFADGALGSRGAALIEDYSDKPGWKGFLLTPEEKWKPLIKAWYDGGWQVNVHGIGDKANKVILDAMEAVVGDDLTAGRERRMRLEHAQIMQESDISRAVKLGVIGSYQPTHATSDMWYAEDRLGAERLKGAYAWRSYLEQGGRITLGSDFPVESIDPLKGFYAAVTRLAEDGTSPQGKDGWVPEQKLTREEALRGMTVDPAYASFSEDTGSLTIGKRFDAVVWDDDLLTVPENELLEVTVKTTIIDGQIAWGKLGA